ncbi:hypothetical protein M0R01_01395 [bacterium]|nr:hypothetical protein [bacterium]
MKIDQKIFYLSFVILLFLNVGFYLFIPNFSIKTFKSLEESAAIREANDMRYFFTKEISVLDSLSKEWARRSDVHEIFTSNEKDREYIISTNFDYEYIKDLKIDYLSFVTPKGKLLYSVEIGNQSPMSDDFAIGLTSSDIVDKKVGLVRSWYSDEVMAISVRPILDELNNPEGYIIMTKKFDKNIIAYSGKSFSFGVIDGSIESKLNRSSNNTYIDRKSDSNLFIYSFYDDILGDKIFYSRTIMSRDVYNAGLSTINAISYSAFVSQLLMIIAFLFISQRIILGRLKLLISLIKKPQKSKKEAALLDGNDEISSLSQEIDNMLNKVKEHWNSSNEKQKELELILKSMGTSVVLLDEKNSIMSSYFSEKNKEEKEHFTSKKFLENIIENIDDIKEDGIKNINYFTKIKNEKEWYGITISVKKDLNNSRRIIFVIRNITKDMKMQEKTEEKIKELERLNKLMTNREIKMIELKRKIKGFENGKTKK